MYKLLLIVLAATVVSCLPKPKESTHSLLSRLGFDPIHKPGVNYHRKRLADDSDRARHSPNSYNSDTDSHMFVVRLPPHNNFYSDVQPQKLENEVVAKPAANFASNGKPAQVYHWNIPLMKKLAKHQIKSRKDSNIVRLKIKPNEQESVYNFYKQLLRDGKPSIYKLKNKEHVMSIAELAEHQNDRPMELKKSKKTKNKNHHQQKSKHFSKSKKDSTLTHVIPHGIVSNKMHADSKLTYVKSGVNEVVKSSESSNKFVSGLKTPSVYSPSMPKDNSFFKYFEGNGKPKSFYVIDKGENTSRFHRLL